MINFNKHYILFAVTFLCLGCSSSEINTQTYHGVHQKDTAYLTLNIKDNTFYGKYAIHGSNHIKKSGDVQGFIHGDTLIGDFYFKQYRTKVKKREPIALLKRDHKLLVGKGKYYFYIGIPYFDANVPINYEDPTFILSKQ